MKIIRKNAWISCAFCLVLALILTAVTAQDVAASGLSAPGMSSNMGCDDDCDDDSDDEDLGRIVLHAPAGVWTVVQWQDGMGRWHDVEGWRGQAHGGEIAWKVEEKDFRTGPFRWVAYDSNSGRVIGATYSFFLPGANETLHLALQGEWRRPEQPQPDRRYADPGQRRDHDPGQRRYHDPGRRWQRHPGYGC